KVEGFVCELCFVPTAELSISQITNSSRLRSSYKGINMNIADGWVINSYISGFTGFGKFDNAIIASMGVLADVGPGPIHVNNNYIDAYYSNVFFGGSDAPPDPNHVATIQAGATIGQATLSSVT